MFEGMYLSLAELDNQILDFFDAFADVCIEASNEGYDIFPEDEQLDSSEK